MKLGYSIFLGEHVDATAVVHKDCERFQIVCPACHEPTFKVEPSEASGRGHYFAHYRRDAALNELCELRTSAITTTDRERCASLSRDQRIRYFLSVVQQAALDRWVAPVNHSHIREVIGGPLMRRLLRPFEDEVRGICSRERTFFSEHAYDYIDNEFAVTTTFARTVQARIGSDMLDHLLTPAARKSFHCLFGIAFLVLHGRCEQTTEASVLSDAAKMCISAEQVRRHFDYMKKFTQGLFHAPSPLLLNEMMATRVGPPFALRIMPYAQKVSFDIAYELFGTLATLPYFELLRQRLAPHAKAS